MGKFLLNTLIVRFCIYFQVWTPPLSSTWAKIHPATWMPPMLISWIFCTPVPESWANGAQMDMQISILMVVLVSQDVPVIRFSVSFNKPCYGISNKYRKFQKHSLAITPKSPHILSNRL